MKEETRLLGIFSFIVSGITLFSSADLALAKTAPNNPYSPLWFLLNPLYETQLPYRFYLMVFQGVAWACMLWALERWDLPFRVALLQMVVGLLFAVLHWSENVTVISFAWTAWYAWPLVGFAAQKLPLGWSWDLQDAHWRCLQTCFSYSDGTRPPLGVLNRSMMHEVVYALVALVVLYPLWAKWIGHFSAARSLKAYIPWLYRGD